MTEKQLLQGITGTAGDGAFHSTVKGVDYIFDFRSRQSDCNPACEPFEAYFSLDDGIIQTIEELLPNSEELVIKAQLMFIGRYENAWKELRKIYNLTQKQLSEATGIPKRTIEDWECDRRKAPDYIFELVRFKIAHTK